MIWLAVGIGGAMGSMARHGVNVATTRFAGQSVPYATAVVNVAGCFVIGLLAGAVASEMIRVSETWRAFVFVGILGGFTTFSSLGLDTLTLARDGSVGLALGNVAGQVIIGIASVFFGFSLLTAATRH